VRVPDEVLQCVGYLAEYITSDATGEVYDWKGSAFSVAVPSLYDPKQQFFYFVTALHLLRDVQQDQVRIVINKKGGGREVIKPTDWWRHPTDDSADVAVTPYNLPASFDVKQIITDSFLTTKIMESKKMGIGDDVFAPGLFEFVPGSGKRNLPLLRHGNVAMLPEEPIQVGTGFSQMYLVEARSFGGLSGSPVFARETVSLNIILPDGSKSLLVANGSAFHLLGMVWGHWDQDSRGVNMGIAAVTPATKILETLFHPELMRIRAEAETRHMQAISPRHD
jgi:hypothetical protein